MTSLASRRTAALTRFLHANRIMVDVISTTTVAGRSPSKARVEPVADTDRRWVRLVFSYVAWATAWLLFGTLVGEYPGHQVRRPGHRSRLVAQFREASARTHEHRVLGLVESGDDRHGAVRRAKDQPAKLFSFPLAYVSLALINASVLSATCC